MAAYTVFIHLVILLDVHEKKKRGKIATQMKSDTNKHSPIRPHGIAALCYLILAEFRSYTFYACAAVNSDHIHFAM